MKKKIALLALVLVLATAFVALFSFTAFAEGEEITVRYAGYNGETRAKATPNEDGSYTLRTEKLSKNGTVTLADGTVVDKVFYGWFTKDGTLYAPGETVTFTESTDLYEAYGVEVFTPEDLAAVKINNYVKIGADMTINFELKSDWGTSVYDLNGHTLTSTNKNHVVWNYRGATIFLGEGKVIHEPSSINTNDKDTGGIVYQHHGYGDTGNPQYCWIGKGVEFVTPYNFIRSHNSPNHDDMPNVEIYGKVTAKNFIRAGVLKNSNVTFHESADVTLTGTGFFDCTDTTSALVYMNLTLGGRITLTNPDALFISDFVISSKFNISQVTNGSFTVSSADAERFAMLLPDTLMLKATENDDGTVTYNVTESDCIHDWVLDKDASVEAVPGTAGLDVFSCTKCGASKQTITVYTPEKVEINVTVRTEAGDKQYSVLAEDVFEFQFNGFGASALCYIAGLKDTAEFTADQIVAIEVPAGVAQFGDFDNSTLETINILDGAEIEFGTLNKLTGLRTINIGSAKVNFVSLVNSYVEKISSKVAGADLTFANSCFKKGLNIKSLEMCAGSKYTFGVDSFRESGLTQLIFPDNSTISWANTAFAECQSLEYIYIGANIGVKEVKNGSAVFDGISNLKKVVIMDLTYLGEWAFSTKEQGKAYGPLCDLTMYIHSEALTMHVNAFNNRKNDHHVFIYTVQTTLPSTINNCNRVIYQGIGHAYTSQVITPSTCVTQGTAGYVTDCPCGIDYRDNTYRSYSSYDSSLDNVDHPAFGKDIVDLPLLTEHTDSDIVNNVVFANGFADVGAKTYKCLYCDETVRTEEVPSFPALFTTLGYSGPENGGGGIALGYKVNAKAIDEYTQITGKTLEYGVFAVSQSKLGDGDVFNAEGVAADGVLSAPIIRRDFAAFELKITGFVTDEQKNAKIAMGAYVVILNGDVKEFSYLQPSTPADGEKYSFVTYNELTVK